MRGRIFFLATAVSLLVTLCSCGVDGRERPDFDMEGLFLLAKNGQPMIVSDDGSGCPCTMTAAVEAITFEGLTDGDRIRIRCLDIMESWPGQIRVFGVEKLSDGERSDISSDILSRLAESGWLPGESDSIEAAE